MNKTQKPLMLAYILFLIVSLLYHSISSIFNIEFSAWERILVGTTIASYFFTLSSSYKFFIKTDTNTLNFAEEHLELSKQFITKEMGSCLTDEEKKYLLESENELIDHFKGIISKTEKDIKKNKRKVFWCDVIGYLLFFCIITISPIYSFLSMAEETFTLAAFIFILIIEYAESVYKVRVEDVQKKILNSTKSAMRTVDEYNKQQNND